MDAKQTLAEVPMPTPQTGVKQTLANPTNLSCKYCTAPITENSYFCPTCGKKLKEPPFKFSIGKSILLVLFSIFFAPLGIFPAIRHLRINDTKARALGIVLIIVTVISTVFVIMIFKNYIDSVNRQLNDVNYLNNVYSNPQGSVEDQVNQLQNLK